MRRLLAAFLALLSVTTLTACQEGQTLPPVIEENLPKAEEVISKAEEVLSDAFSHVEDIPQKIEELLPDLGEPLPGSGAEESTQTDAAPAEDTGETAPAEETGNTTAGSVLSEDSSYDSRDDVALYLVTYQHLPNNYITKAEARALGWSGGGLEAYAPGKCIGGDRFGNREGNLPKGHTYTECDIDTLGASSRGVKRIVFDESFSVYYTSDHYETFQQLYGGAAP